MISDERLLWLFGEERPVRVVPAGLSVTGDNEELRARLAEVDESLFFPFNELTVRDPHPEWLQVPHNQTLFHPHGHHIIVSSATPGHVEDHLASSWIWMESSPPVERPDGPRPLYLRELINGALVELTGQSIDAAVVAHGGADHPPLREVIGGAAAEVAASAAAALDEGLQELEDTGVIDAADRDEVRRARLIEALLDEPLGRVVAGDAPDEHGHAASLIANRGSVITRLGPATAGHDLVFIMRDIGSVKRELTKSWGPTSALRCITEKLTVTGGKVKWKVEEKCASEWKKRFGKTYKEGTTSGDQELDCTCSASCKAEWKMGVVGEDATNSYEVKGQWNDTGILQS